MSIPFLVVMPSIKGTILSFIFSGILGLSGLSKLYLCVTAISSFLDNIFEIYEIRGRVGDINGITFCVRTNEQNHTIPHVHAKYGDYNISIEIATGKVLAGNLPKKNQKVAVEWVLKNKDKLLVDWRNIAISAKTTMTKSKLDFKD